MIYAHYNTLLLWFIVQYWTFLLVLYIMIIYFWKIIPHFNYVHIVLQSTEALDFIESINIYYSLEIWDISE